MEKRIKIGDREIPLKSTGATGRLYRFAFGKDIFKDFFKLAKDMENLPEMDVNDENFINTVMQTVDLAVIENLVWAMAKTADESIVSPDAWFDEFEDMFSVYLALPDIMDMIIESMSTTVIPKKMKAMQRK